MPRILKFHDGALGFFSLIWLYTWNVEAYILPFWEIFFFFYYFVNFFSVIFSILLMKTLLVGYYVVYLSYFLGYSLNHQTLLLINFIFAFNFLNFHRVSLVLQLLCF